MKAITNHNIELVQLLLEYHADLDIKDSDGSTLLLWLRKQVQKRLKIYFAMDETKNNANNAG